MGLVALCSRSILCEAVDGERIEVQAVTVVKEDPNLVPLCPHCNASLNEVHGRTVTVEGSNSFQFGKRYIYACPSCRKALGISHRKGFWQG
jgi:uncharacterized protein with PIN domain